MCKMDLALNNLQWLICHETKTSGNFLSKSPNIAYTQTKAVEIKFLLTIVYYI